MRPRLLGAMFRPVSIGRGRNVIILSALEDRPHELQSEEHGTRQNQHEDQRGHDRGIFVHDSMLRTEIKYAPARNRTWTRSFGGCCDIHFTTGA